MKRYELLFAFVLLIASITAQNPNWDWANGAGSTNTDNGLEICVDAAGNTYATGLFTGTITMGGFTLTAAGNLGNSDVYVAKLDPNGNYLWAVRGGGGSTDVGYGIAVDAEGNVFVAGYFYGTSFYGSDTLVSAGYFDLFIAKLDSNGNWLWAKRAGGQRYDHAYGVTTDDGGNCYITGYFTGTADFGPFSLSGPAFYGDVYVAKLDTDGTWLWAQGSVCAETDDGQSVAYDGSGGIYVTGAFEGTISLGSTTLVSYGNIDAYVAKIDTAGNWIWAVQGGGPFPDYATSVAVDAAGNAYVAGNLTSEDAYFGPYTLHGDGWANDTFIAKLDPAGNYLWASMGGGIEDDEVQDIAVDAAGACYVTGYFSYTATFGTHSISSNNDSNDIFLCKADAAGNWLWALSAGGTNGDAGMALCHQGYSTYLTGVFRDTISFGTHTLTATGLYNDIFIAKLTEPSNGISTFPATWDFENPTFPPDGWTSVDADGGGSNWQMTTSQNHTPSGSQSAMHSYSSEAPEGQTGWLITPAISVPAGQRMTLRFWQQNWFEGDYGYNGLLVNTTGDPNAVGWTQLWSPPRVCSEWQQVFVDIGAYGGQTVYFAFKYMGFDAHEWYLDDVSIYEVLPVATFPVLWDFEGADFPPEGWSTDDLDFIPTSWQATTEFNHTPDGSQAAMHPYSGLWPQFPGQDGWLITPPVEVPAGLNMVLDFWYFNQYSNGNKYCAVKVNTVNDPSDPNWVQLWRPALAYEEWRQQAVNISAYGGQTVYFAFHYQGDDADNWIVDDVTIHHPEGTDTQGPVITFLPPLNSPRHDLPIKLTATVTDDPVYNNALGGITLHWKIWGGDEFNELPMTLESGNTYSAWIPAPGFYTEIDYYFEAWDVLDNYSNTENYSWFYVENPCWLSYDWGGTGHEAFNQAFGVANVYPNPYFDQDMPMQVLQTGCGANMDAAATLCVYAYDGTVMTPLMAPQQVVLSGSDWITYTDLSAQELMVETPYFIVAYTDIPAYTGIWHDRCLDYGASFTFDGATLSAKLVPGSWVLPVQITNGALAAPEVTISRVDGYPQLTWNAVPDAQSYHIYYSTNPYAADPWNLLDSTPELNYTYTGTNPIYFFKVTADSAGPEKASLSSGYVPGARVDPIPGGIRLKPKPDRILK